MRLKEILTALAILLFSPSAHAATVIGTANTDASGNFSLSLPFQGLYFSRVIFQTPIPVTSYVHVDYTEIRCPRFSCPDQMFTTQMSRDSETQTTTEYRALYGTGYWWPWYRRDGTITRGISNITANLIGNADPNSVIPYRLTYAAAPEPATWAMMILGFGAIGGVMRRRSSRVGAARYLADGAA